MDEFRMQPTGWTKPVTLDELTAETARSIGLGRDMYAYANDADDLKDAREIITAAREYERALIIRYLREVAALERGSHELLQPFDKLLSGYLDKLELMAIVTPAAVVTTPRENKIEKGIPS